jgi:hypothetical protein
MKGKMYGEDIWIRLGQSISLGLNVNLISKSTVDYLSLESHIIPADPQDRNLQDIPVEIEGCVDLTWRIKVSCWKKKLTGKECSYETFTSQFFISKEQFGIDVLFAPQEFKQLINLDEMTLREIGQHLMRKFNDLNDRTEITEFKSFRNRRNPHERIEGNVSSLGFKPIVILGKSVKPLGRLSLSVGKFLIKGLYDDDTTSCSICTGKFEFGKFWRLDCNHKFHDNCISQVRKKSFLICPFCVLTQLVSLKRPGLLPSLPPKNISPTLQSVLEYLRLTLFRSLCLR